MSRAPQKRRVATHERLIAAAKDIVASAGYADLRVEEVVLRAGVAKGTFFSHFSDKDALLEALIGDELTRAMAIVAASDVPQNADEFAAALAPLIAAMGTQRAAFDVILRNSGAMNSTTYGPIAKSFVDQVILMTDWMTDHRRVRQDVAPALLAEGVQAFVVQAIAMQFCAVESQVPLQDRLRAYLDAWLFPRP